MNPFQPFDAGPLEKAGLNRQAVFDIDALPDDVAALVRASCTSGPYRQLILIGHAGRQLWQSVQESGLESNDPIDAFSVRTVQGWFARCAPQNRYEIIYPGDAPIGLQRLGQLAGWHHASPFMVGVDPKWGSWFAYRALALADTAFEPSRPQQSAHPCDSCAGRPCVAACPAGALAGGQFDLHKCITERKRDGSDCKSTCLARTSCPVGEAHRYCDAQMRHIYSLSLQAIERYY